MGLRSSAIKAIAKGFDIERKIKQSPVTKIAFLKRDGTMDPYGLVKVFDKGFISRFDDLRNQIRIEIATEEDLSEMMPGVFGVATVKTVSGPVYSVSGADVVPPDDDRFTWIVYGTIKVNEVYKL